MGTLHDEKISDILSKVGSNAASKFGEEKKILNVRLGKIRLGLQAGSLRKFLVFVY